MTGFIYTFLALYSVGSFGNVSTSPFLSAVTLVHAVLIALVKNVDNLSGYKSDLGLALPLIIYASR